MKLKKNKIWIIGLGAGLMATTGIATPLIVSCSSNDPSKPQDTDGNDKKYNITQATYDNLEQQLIFKYKHKKMAEGLLGDNLNDEMDNLQTQLNSLRKESNKVSYNYTFRTDCLIDLAIKNYGVQISRGFSSSLDADFLSEQENYGNAYRRYLLNNHFSPTNANTLVRSFSSNFGRLKGNICAQFDDPLYSLNQLKANLISCFDDSTKQLEYAHTQQLAANFFKEYSFTYNGTAFLDKIIKNNPKTFVVDANISQLIPQIFNCTKGSKKEPIELKENWTTDLIPNYIIKPILKDIKSDIYSNTHLIEVAWGLMPAKYADKDFDEQEKATAYYFTPKKEAFKQKVKSFDDFLNLKNEEKTHVLTEMHISKELEKENIKTAYGNLVFSYSTNRDDHAYEEFAVCLDKRGEPIECGLNYMSLAKTGLMIQEPSDKTPILLKNTISKLCDLATYNIKSIQSGEYQLTLKEKFLIFTNFLGNSTIVSDNEHSVKTDVYAWYKNSPHENKDLSIKLNTSPIEGKGIVYSSQFYDNAKKAFDEARNFRDNLLNLASDDNSMIAKIAVTTSVLVVMAVLNGVMIAKCIISTLLAPISGWLELVVLFLSVLLEMTAIIMISINSYALANTIKHKMAVKELIKQPAFQNIDSKIKQDEKIYDNKETFLMSPLTVIQPSVSYFKTLYQQADYQNLAEISETLGANKETFDKEVNKYSMIISWIDAALIASLIACIVAGLIRQGKLGEAAAEEAQAKQVEFQEVVENHTGRYVATYSATKQTLTVVHDGKTVVISGLTNSSDAGKAFFDIAWACLPFKK